MNIERKWTWPLEILEQQQVWDFPPAIAQAIQLVQQALYKERRQYQ